MKSRSFLEVYDAPNDDFTRLCTQYGYLAYLAGWYGAHSPAQDNYAVLEEGVRQGNLEFFFDGDGQPVGFIAWALLAPPVHARLQRESRLQLHLSEWNEDEHAVVVDAVLLPGSAPAALREFRRRHGRRVPGLERLRRQPRVAPAQGPAPARHGEEFFRQLGYAAYLAARAKAGANRTRYLYTHIAVLIREQSIRFYFNSEGWPVSYVAWMDLASPPQRRLLARRLALPAPAAWPAALCIVDLAAPYGHARYALRDALRALFRQVDSLCYLRLKGGQPRFRTLSRHSVSAHGWKDPNKNTWPDCGRGPCRHCHY